MGGRLDGWFWAMFPCLPAWAQLHARRLSRSGERLWSEDRHDFLDHLLVAVETPRLVAAERIGDRVDEAAIAERARFVRQVLRAQDARQVVVGDERPRDGDRVGVAPADDLADQ